MVGESALADTLAELLAELNRRNIPMLWLAVGHSARSLSRVRPPHRYSDPARAAVSGNDSVSRIGRLQLHDCSPITDESERRVDLAVYGTARPAGSDR
jgi:hypothetical protein